MEVRVAGRVSAGVLFVLALVSGAVSPVTTTPSQAAEKQRADTKRGLASEAVREALQHEVYGLTDEREQLLREAAATDPKFSAARWHRGLVVDDQGRWVDHEQFVSPGLRAKLAEYERARGKHPDTVEGQLALAAWCGKHKLIAQQRAHLMRVLELSPEHAEAREALGFVRFEGSWVNREEIAAERARAAKAAQDLTTWRPVLEAILKDLRHRSSDRQGAAKERLQAIHDPAALPAMLEAVFTVSDEEAGPLLDAMVQMAGPESAQALAQVAVFAGSLPKREAAAQRLAQRDLQAFVPQLLASLYSPVTSQATTMLLPNGRLALRHTFVREGMDKHQVMQLDTQFVRKERFGGNQRESTARAIRTGIQETIEREQAASQQNAMTAALNERIMWVLSQSTKQQHADPGSWWNWWNELNEVAVLGSKDVAFMQQEKTVAVVDYVPPPTPQTSESSGESGTDGAQPTSSGSGGGVQRVERGRDSWFVNNRRTGDCLAAGTCIWTIHGPKEIQTMQIGDLVMARNQDTGELAYKPVIRTSVRPLSTLFKIRIEGETIETSGGHLFWVSGEGWVRSRELRDGMMLHGAAGPSRILSIEQGQTAETYNVVVADFNTYFVGDAKVFSHDNTVRKATRAIVPGLRLE